jgi:RNA polymerase sigma-70 factor (ECF subfamily)
MVQLRPSAVQPALDPPAEPDAGADDAALVAAACADPAQFALLYERYVGPVYRFCYIQLGSRVAAEDATSEVFLKALAALSDFRGGSLPGWLLQIARNTVIDQHRRKKPVTSIEDRHDLAGREQTPEDAAVSAEAREALRRALADLPHHQRTAVVLQLAGWSGEQIAGALGKSRTAVYMLRVRALARLAKTLRAAGWRGEDLIDAQR